MVIGSKMMNKYIELKNVTVDIPIFDSNRSLRQALYNKYVGKLGGEIHKSSRKHVFVRALHNISFKIETGDRLGLIGHNGAGKSTLLNVLAGIYQPHSGSLMSHGKVTPLFNPNLGLDIDDTGYENIYTMGMYYELNKSDIDAKCDEIIAFSELGDFIHSPVRTYSSGMILRLSFAIVTSLNPEILLLDEGIGAGDAAFAAKAASRLDSFYEKIDILVLASHSDSLIKQLCNKAILLDHGRILKMGAVDEVLDYYHERTAMLA